MQKKHLEEALFGAGCFWGVEETFRVIEGVVSTEVGYAGGQVKNPSYKQVCGGDTGHIEVVHLLFDPEIISYKELVKVFFESHDPTQKDRQGPDVGRQYASVIFYYTDEQKKTAEEVKSTLIEKGIDAVTEIQKVVPFYRAEEYHQKYVLKTGRKVC